MQNLLDLALEDPEEALVVARRVLATSDNPVERSYAYQAVGIVYRDAGQLTDATRELKNAMGAARSAGDLEREADAQATYGVILAYMGRTSAALAAMDSALELASGEVAAKVRVRQAGVLANAGRYSDARAAVQAALDHFARASNLGWEAKARLWLGHLELRLGKVAAAERLVAAAELCLRASGVAIDRIAVIGNLAEISLARGNVADALRRFREAELAYEAAGLQAPYDLVGLHAEAYLTAGLPGLATELLTEYGKAAELHAVDEALFLLVRATALLACGDAEDAVRAATAARDLFRRQRNEWFYQRARLEMVRAGLMLGGRHGLGREAREVALALHAEGADEAPAALTIAGRLAAAEPRRWFWTEAAAYRRRANGLVRATAHLAAALDRDADADRGGALRACAAGLDAIDEYRRLVGSSELRAQATTHGRELTEIALRHAADQPRTLLRWSERTRATALAQPPATSSVETIPPALAALRDNGRRLIEARQAGEPTDELEKERRRLEREVRTDSHLQSAADSDPQRPMPVEQLVAGVGDGCLIELVDVDGTLHVLVVCNGRVRRRIAGTTSEVLEISAMSKMLLRRASRGRPADVTEVARRLQEAVLGDAVRLIPDGPVVIAPPARLHDLAWALLPALHDRPFSVVPSGAQWLRAQAITRPRRRRTVLVAGPDLASGGAEVPVLAERHPDALHLAGPEANLEATLEALDGADLVHLAAHGKFRGDSPLFSAIELADGPLVVHDLERLKRAPYRLVLSACESGILAPVGADEVLGLAASLFSIGSAGLVCSVGEVNDAATAELMVDLHDSLARGADPAAALHEVRQSAIADPIAAGTAAAFLALGT